MNILIRKSHPSDLQQVYELTKKCFLYQDIAIIKNNYVHHEDSIFMVKILTFS